MIISLMYIGLCVFLWVKKIVCYCKIFYRFYYSIVFFCKRVIKELCKKKNIYKVLILVCVWFVGCNIDEFCDDIVCGEV